MFFPFSTRPIRPKRMVLQVSKQKDTDPEQVEFYRNCSIDLTRRITENWNEVWSYTVTLDFGNGTQIGKGNGLISKYIAVKCARAWIDDVLRDRKD